MRIKLVQHKTFTTPRRPFEKERLDQELKLIGEYGLRNKREVWRVKYALAKIRKSARELLTLDEKDPKRLFEGKFLIYVKISTCSILPRPRSHENIAEISAKSQPKHPSCGSCRGRIFINSQSLSVLLL